MKKKTVAVLLALVLVMGVAAGGTVAWLLDTTAPIVNTFTAGDVDIELAESENLDLQMVPGTTITKDPAVTVKANSEVCYVFVKLEKSANFDTFMTYTVADGWTAGDGTNIPANVYYRTVGANTADQAFKVLENDQVAVKSDVTKAQLNALTSTTQPTLTVTAYACQQAKTGGSFTPAEAWTALNPTT